MFATRGPDDRRPMSNSLRLCLFASPREPSSICRQSARKSTMKHTAQRVTMDVVELGRLRWRCRRGMRELDVVLTRYLERDWPAAGAADRAAFQALLERQDPEINTLLLGWAEPQDEVLARVLECLRRSA